ncbi:MAG: hypothetical protein ACKO6Q_06285 [Bacteroidota bacterium]
MKILFMLSIFSVLSVDLFGQSLEDRQERFDKCLSVHVGLQDHIRAHQSRYQDALSDVRMRVDGLVASYGVQHIGEVIPVADLRAAVELSMHLRDLDAESDSAYYELRESLLAEAWSEGICSEDLSFGQYQELLDNYLEDRVIRPVDHYAATYFATLLGFRSMLMIQLKAKEDWLQRQGFNWTELHPFHDLPVNEEMYWAILNADWSIELRNPEPELSSLHIAAREGGEAEKMKFKDILLFIFNNWDEIKDLLSWLEELVLTDCSPTVTARIKSDTRDVNVMQELSPDVERRIYYQVGQRGVRADFRSTRTRIWGKASLYKRKRNRFVKDKTQVVGIAYCTQQWNVCDDRPWPSNGQPFQFAGVHRRGKAKFSERHPYALAIQQLNTEFINFPLFYNRALVDQVYLLGNGGCF